MNPNVQPVISKPNNKILRKIYSLFRLFGFFMTKAERDSKRIKGIKWNTSVTWYSPITDFDLTQSDLVKEADVIHLHWIAGFVDYESFFSNIKKTIVWTLHDENIALGGFHYRRDKINNYGYCKQLEDCYANLK